MARSAMPAQLQNLWFYPLSLRERVGDVSKRGKILFCGHLVCRLTLPPATAPAPAARARVFLDTCTLSILCLPVFT